MPTLLVTATELANHPEWVIVDCRHDLKDPDTGTRGYAQGHIPRAQFVHLDRDLSAAKTGLNGRHPLPDPAQLAKVLEKSGISNSSQVVAYDASGGMYAARLWWSMRWLGHKNVAVLDGGLGAWTRAGLPLQIAVDAPTPGRFVPVPNASMLATADDILLDLARDDATILVVDARSPDRFAGENEIIDPVAGHIPRAANRFFGGNLDAHGCFRPAAELRRDFLAVIGNQPAQATVQQCGSGVTACHNLLAMEIAGLPGARLYAGSWSEWCADPKRPVATGCGVLS